MNLRTTAARVLLGTAVLAGALAVSAAPAAAATTSFAVVDADGVSRGSVSAEPNLVTVCDRLADGVQVAVDFTFADGTSSRRIAPLGGCNSAFPFGGSPIVSVRGVADTFAGEWVAVS
jgi:phosphodiesterase/alkaline phosphatase D-like protein